MGGNAASAIECEAESTNGEGVDTWVYSRVIGCYIHDSKIGIDGNTAVISIGNIVDTCTTSIKMVGLGSTAAYNSIYGGITGIDITTQTGNLGISNIVDNPTTGISSSSSAKAYDYFDYNCYDAVTTDVSNVEKGANSVDGDPGFTSPGQDVTLGSGSNCLDAGLQVGTNQGATGDYKWNIGVDQDDVSAGGGGRRAGWSIQ